jgi:hypothetical protein
MLGGAYGRRGSCDPLTDDKADAGNEGGRGLTEPLIVAVGWPCSSASASGVTAMVKTARDPYFFARIQPLNRLDI